MSVISGFLRASGGFISKIVLVETTLRGEEVHIVRQAHIAGNLKIQAFHQFRFN